MDWAIGRGARRRRSLLAFTVIAALVAEPLSALAEDTPPAPPAAQGAAPAPQAPAETAAPAEEPAPAFTSAELEATRGETTHCGRREPADESNRRGRAAIRP